MLINGKELDFKISNLKDAGNMELALKEMGKGEGGPGRQGSFYIVRHADNA